MKNNTVILAPHSYVVVHRKQPDIYDVYEIETGKWILSRTNPDNILQIFSENFCTFKFIDENYEEFKNEINKLKIKILNLEEHKNENP